MRNPLAEFSDAEIISAHRAAAAAMRVALEGDDLDAVIVFGCAAWLLARQARDRSMIDEAQSNVIQFASMRAARALAS